MVVVELPEVGERFVVVVVVDEQFGQAPEAQLTVQPSVGKVQANVAFNVPPVGALTLAQ
jgi:hypothetical protein